MRRGAARGVRAGALLAGLSCLLAGCVRETEPQPVEAAWRLEGEELERSGRPVEALGVYAEAARSGSDLDAELAIVDLLLRYRRVGWAVQRLEALVRAHPGNEALLDRHYRATAANRLFSRSLESAVALLERRPGDPELLRHLGVLSLAEERPEAAAGYLERAVGEDDGSAAAWYLLGRAREALHRDGAAREAYERAHALRPGNAAVRWRLARLVARAGDAATARRLLAEGAAAEELSPRSLYLLATLTVRLGDGDEGRRLLALHEARAAAEEERINLRTRYEAFLEVCAGSLAEGDVDRAERALRRAVEADRTEDTRFHLLAGELALHRDSPWDALEGYRRATAGGPRLWRPRYLLAEQLVRLGLLREAAVELRRTIGLQPLAPEPRALLAHALGLLDAPGADEAAAVAAVLRSVAPEGEAPPEGPLPLGHPARRGLIFDALQLQGLAEEDEDALPFDELPSSPSPSPSRRPAGSEQAASASESTAVPER